MKLITSFILFLITISLFGQSVFSEIDTPSGIDTGLYITGSSKIGLVIDNVNVNPHVGYNESNGISIRSGATGVFAESLNGSAFFGIGSHAQNAAIQGRNSIGHGIYGQSGNSTGYSPTTAGVYGSSRDEVGVFGRSNSNYGVLGESTSGRGVVGVSSMSYGVYGESSISHGVFGKSEGGIGVFASSDENYGMITGSISGIGLRAVSTESVAAEFVAHSSNTPDIEFPGSAGIISSDRDLESSDLELWSNDDLTVVVDRDNSANTGSFQVQNSNGVSLLHVHELNGTDIRGNLEMKSVGGNDNGIIQSDRDRASSDLVIDSNHDIVLRLDANGGESGQLRVEDTGNTVIFRLFESGNLNIAGTLNQGSDRHRKHHIVPVDVTDVINKIDELPLFNWKYIGEDVPHLGPMAQDFYKVFGLGESETTISSIDIDGVSLAGIKALITENRMLREELDLIKEQLGEVIIRLEEE